MTRPEFSILILCFSYLLLNVLVLFLFHSNICLIRLNQVSQMLYLNFVLAGRMSVMDPIILVESLLYRSWKGRLCSCILSLHAKESIYMICTQEPLFYKDFFFLYSKVAFLCCEMKRNILLFKHMFLCFLCLISCCLRTVSGLCNL